MGRRYEKMGQATKLIQPPQDIIAFVKTLHIPETLTVSKHVFSPPQPADPAQVRMKFCPKVCNKYKWEILKKPILVFNCKGRTSRSTITKTSSILLKYF